VQKRGMDVEQKNKGNLLVKIELDQQKEDENSVERGLFIPLIKNESKQDRANRILSMMEESNARLSRMLDIFSRISR
jgi:hypothetical protein